MGKTQGVRLSSRPAANSASSAPQPPCVRARASGLSGAAEVVPPTGGAVMKPAAGIAGAGAAPGGPATTATGIVKGTEAGVRHTWSLQAWNLIVPSSARSPGVASAAATSGTSIAISPS